MPVTRIQGKTANGGSDMGRQDEDEQGLLMRLKMRCHRREEDSSYNIDNERNWQGKSDRKENMEQMYSRCC